MSNINTNKPFIQFDKLITFIIVKSEQKEESYCNNMLYERTIHHMETTHVYDSTYEVKTHQNKSLFEVKILKLFSNGNVKV